MNELRMERAAVALVGDVGVSPRLFIRMFKRVTSVARFFCYICFPSTIFVTSRILGPISTNSKNKKPSPVGAGKGLHRLLAQSATVGNSYIANGVDTTLL